MRLRDHQVVMRVNLRQFDSNILRRWRTGIETYVVYTFGAYYLYIAVRLYTQKIQSRFSSLRFSGQFSVLIPNTTNFVLPNFAALESRFRTILISTFMTLLCSLARP